MTGSRLATINDMADCRILLEEVFEQFSSAIWDIICDEILREEWSTERLRGTVIKLLRSKSFVQQGDRRPRLVPRDILETPTPRVYGHGWYLSLSAAERKDVEIYDVPDRGMLYAPAGTNANLPRWDAAAARERMLRPALPEHSPEVSEATQNAITDMKRRLHIEDQMQKLERQNAQLLETLEARDAYIAMLQDAETQELRLVNLTVENGHMADRIAVLESEREEMIALLRWNGDRGELVIRWEALLERLMRDSVDGTGLPGESPGPPNRTTSQQRAPYTTIGHAVDRFMDTLRGPNE